MSLFGRVVSAIDTARFVAWELGLVAARSMLSVGRGPRIVLAVVVMVGLAVAMASWLMRERPDAWRGVPPTAEQMRYARELGLTIPEGATKGAVADQIQRAKGSRRDDN